jgi:hypothetical protein
MNFFINLKDMIEVLSTNHKEWLIQDTGKIEKFTASILNIYDKYSIEKTGYFTGADGQRVAYSHNIMNQRLNTVSSDHCQDGTTQRIYKLTPIKLTIPPIRLSTPTSYHTPNASIRNHTPIYNPTPNSSIYSTPMSYIRNPTPTPLPLPLLNAIQPPRGKRCLKGTRRNKRTGNCDPNVPVVRVPVPVPVRVPVPVNVPVALRKRCPNGTRKNKRTGDCDPY